VIYVYAVTETTGTRPPVKGLEERPLSFLNCGKLQAVFSEHKLKPEASEKSLVRHERVVEGLMRSGPVVPMRFGQVVEEDVELRKRLVRRSEQITSMLGRVRGKVEIAVRALAMQSLGSKKPTTRPPLGASGHAYMTSRLHEERMARALEDSMQEIANEIHGRLGTFAAASQLREHADSLIMAGAYLVPKDRVHDFGELVQALGRDYLDTLELVCTGPWPPYSFVDLDLCSDG
jgi:predicted transcriptional regulator